LRENRVVLLNKIRSKWVWELVIACTLAIVLIAIVPLMLTGFRLTLLGRFLALAIAALGIDLIWGYTGILSLGHGVFFALGGYAIAMHLNLQFPADATTKLPEFMGLYGVNELPFFWYPFFSFPLTAIAIVAVPTILAGLLGYLVFRNRIRGVYFSILTQAATIVFFNFFNGQQKLLNGTNGLTNYKTFLGMDVNSPQTQYLFYVTTIVLLIGAYFLCRWLTQGRFGNLLKAIRDDENRVRFSGYDPTGFKVLVFAISAGLAGIAGAIYTLQTGLVSPNQMDIAFSTEMVIWVAVGGRSTLIGAVLGAPIVNFAKTFLSESFPEIWLFFQGALFLTIVTILPGGLVSLTRSPQFERLLNLLGVRQQVNTYPSLESDREVQGEREDFGN
jgi:urea transport system permease protein